MIPRKMDTMNLKKKKKKVGKRHFAVVPCKKKVNGKHNFLTWLESMSRRKYQALWLKWKQYCKE